MTFTSIVSTSPKSDVSTIELCHKKKSNITSITAALSVLSVITTLLIIAVVFMAIITALIYKRMLSHAVSNKVIYECPDNIKSKSFHMTQSSVYEIHNK